MKKTYKELRSEINEAMGMAARRAVGRRMKLLAKKGTTIRKKAINMMRALPIEKARKRAADAQKQRDEIRDTTREINHLKAEMHEIKHLLKELVENRS